MTTPPTAVGMTARDQHVEEIYDRSKDVALTDINALGATCDYFHDDNDTFWVSGTTRGKAMAFYAVEHGAKFTDIRARRVYMTADLDAIRDMAADIVASGDYDDDELCDVIAYTWDDCGWCWQRVPKDHPNAVAFWECTERRRTAGKARG